MLLGPTQLFVILFSNNCSNCLAYDAVSFITRPVARGLHHRKAPVLPKEADWITLGVLPLLMEWLPYLREWHPCGYGPVNNTKLCILVLIS